MAALRAGRARQPQVIGRRLSGLAAQFGALCLPFGFHHSGEAMDKDVKEAAHQQAEQKHQPGEQGWFAMQQLHQTTEPILKIGMYMAITMPPMRVPSTTMMIGSIRLDSASTASSTSAS